nr:ankyrin repeat domain-containing protein [Sphingomicrobium nitratireducens]
MLAVVPAQGQSGPEGEKFIAAVREFNGAVAVPMLQAPGSRIANYKGHDGETGLHIATRAKKVAWIEAMLIHDADPDILDKDGETALHIAIRNDHLEAVDRLLAFDADPNLGNRWGETPAILAVQLRRPDILESLLEEGADPDKVDHAGGMSARQYAARDTRNPELLAIIEKTQAQPKLEFGPILR